MQMSFYVNRTLHVINRASCQIERLLSVFNEPERGGQKCYGQKDARD
jgi:hypothetical protein